MSILFTPAKIGALDLPNRLVRSATAECLADADGHSTPRLVQFYRELTRGGVGLIISGHLYIHPRGKCHPEMTGIYNDALIPGLAELTDAVHQEGGRVAAQINHGGMLCSKETVVEPLAPSSVDSNQQPARGMTPQEILETIEAFAQAARRAQMAGFDSVQLHGAHGYLISQFLSPYVNRRTDRWGGDLQGRMRFLRQVCRAVREQVGPDYPVFIKLGMFDGVKGGLTMEQGVQVVGALEEMGLDGVELSGGIQSNSTLPNPKQPFFRHLAQAARPATRLPIMSVGGYRDRATMEAILETGEADFISLCRPLICEPDWPERLRQGLQDHSRCISGNRCWPKKHPAGITCKCLRAREDNGQ